MRLIYRRQYERYARAHGLTTCGRRKARRAIRQVDRYISRVLKPFVGQMLTPELVGEVKAAICDAAGERDQPATVLAVTHDVATNRIEVEVREWGKAC